MATILTEENLGISAVCGMCNHPTETKNTKYVLECIWCLKTKAVHDVCCTVFGSHVSECTACDHIGAHIRKNNPNYTHIDIAFSKFPTSVYFKPDENGKYECGL